QQVRDAGARKRHLLFSHARRTLALGLLLNVHRTRSRTVIDVTSQLDDSSSVGVMGPPPLGRAANSEDCGPSTARGCRNGAWYVQHAWIALLAVGLVCDFCLAPLFASLFHRPPSIDGASRFALLGIVLAQGNILAAWLAWSELPFLRRLTAHWAAAAIFCFAWLSGFRLCVTHVESDIVRSTIVLAVPLVSIAAQLPLWIVRYFFGWRLVRDGDR